MDEPVQTNASDARQVAHGRKRERTQADRRRELFRWALSTKEGRELLWELLRDLGYLRHIGGPLEAVYGQAALHNQACLWLKEVVVHRDLFLQMQNEAMKRDAQVAKESRAARASDANDDMTTEGATE